tara:strand:- start:1570 stop:1698 length:129 start_codon:yes stop_codon:yes gene_type:complete
MVISLKIMTVPFIGIKGMMGFKKQHIKDVINLKALIALLGGT